MINNVDEHPIPPIWRREKIDPPKNRVSCNSSIWPTRPQWVFVVKIALSSCTCPRAAEFQPDSPKKIAGRNSAGKNATSRKSAEKVHQPAEYKKNISAGGLPLATALTWHRMTKFGTVTSDGAVCFQGVSTHHHKIVGTLTYGPTPKTPWPRATKFGTMTWGGTYHIFSDLLHAHTQY